MNKKNKTSPQTATEAMKMAKATQKPGQTKEQTKLIAQGIQKGIELYKKQQKIKARELDKKLRKVRQEKTGMNDHNVVSSSLSEPFDKKSAFLPWLMLIISWAGFTLYIIGWQQ